MKVITLLTAIVFFSPVGVHSENESKDSIVEFRIVYDEDCSDCIVMKYHNIKAGKEEAIHVGEVVMSGADLKNAKVKKDGYGGPTVILRMNDEGRVKFADVTGQNLKRRIAIIVKGKVISTPKIYERIEGGIAHITGNFDRKEADTMEYDINSSLNLQ